MKYDTPILGLYRGCFSVFLEFVEFRNNLTGLLKYADYSKGTVAGYTNDIQKIWVGLDYKFATK
ncbi:hypothetical protein [Sulfurimonas sp. ST-27]|uniref:hypothetical protein n=1 Tax=Sulfurimonas sp. ST-27 TaxID=3400152 RepID=UPI003AB78671